MHLVEIPERNIKRYIPADLSECDKNQYINMCGLIYKYQSQQLSWDEFQTHAIYYLLNMQPSKGTELTDETKFANIHQLAKLVDAYFEEVEGKKKIKQYYIHNPIERIGNGLRSFYGPNEAFNNVSFGEYVDGLNHFADYAETGEVKYLYYLMATFYRRPKFLLFIRKFGYSYNGDTRRQYNPENLERIADKLKQYPIGVVYGFYLLFASYQKYLTTASFWIEGKEINLSILFQNGPGEKTKKSDIPSIGMRSMLYTMAESGIFGSLEKVRATVNDEILVRMYDIRKRDLDNQAKEKT